MKVKELRALVRAIPDRLDDADVEIWFGLKRIELGGGMVVNGKWLISTQTATETRKRKHDLDRLRVVQCMECRKPFISTHRTRPHGLCSARCKDLHELQRNRKRSFNHTLRQAAIEAAGKLENHHGNNSE